VQEFTIYYSGGQMKKKEMGGAYATYSGQQMCIQGCDGDICGIKITWKI